jgi:hypothetical protein
VTANYLFTGGVFQLMTLINSCIAMMLSRKIKLKDARAVLTSFADSKAGTISTKSLF